MTKALAPAAQTALCALLVAVLAGCSAKSETQQAQPANPATPLAPPVAVATARTPSTVASAAEVKPSSAATPGKSFASQGHQHLAPGTSDTFAYNSDPPTSGPHRELFNDAFFSPTPLPKYVQVHLLEHGNVLLQYDCKCPDIAAALARIANDYDNRLYPANQLQPLPTDVQLAEDQGLAVIVAPYPSMKSKIALTAWTRLETLDAVDEAKIKTFVNAYLHNSDNASR